MKFESVSPESSYERRKWIAGEHYSIVELIYALGQKRVQVWYKLPHYSFPDVCWTQF